jgi:hypothetical protein
MALRRRSEAAAAARQVGQQPAVDPRQPELVTPGSNPPDAERLDALGALEPEQLAAVRQEMTADEKGAQRQSFAKGNVVADKPPGRVTEYQGKMTPERAAKLTAEVNAAMDAAVGQVEEQENLSALAHSLHNAGFDVPLTELATVAPAVRQTARAWLANRDPSTMPRWLLDYHFGPTPAEKARLDEKRDAKPKSRLTAHVPVGETVNPGTLADTYEGELPGAWKKPPDPEPPPMFARADGRNDVLTPQMERLVETVFDVSDVGAEYAHLERQMVLGEQRSDYATVLRALDQAEDNARRAHRLFVNARLEEKRYLIERESVDAALHKAAVESLKESKDKVTIEATHARMVELYAEEHQAGELQKAKVKLTCEHLEQLSFTWTSRCRSLGIILNTLRK